MPRSRGPFEILDRIGPSVYKVDLLGEYGASTTFDVADLSLYHANNEEFCDAQNSN